VEKVMIEGKAWHRITFYGKDGDMVMLSEPKRSLPIKNGKAELMLDDQGYIPADLTENKVTVSLEATIISQDNKETKITIPPYVIDVPLAPLKVVLPYEQSFTTNDDSMLVKIKVTPGSKRVLIGDTNKTDGVNAEGYASATVNLAPNSINTIIISVETANFRKNVYELKVERPIMEVPIELKEPENSTEAKSVRFDGSTEPGATITTNASTSVSLNRTTGIFHFTATLKSWGWNDVMITATSASGRTSTMTHRINHVPKDPGYSFSAQQLDYAYLVAATKALVGRIYQIDGTPVRKIESDVSDYYVFDVGKPGELKLVVLENTTEVVLKPGQYYRAWVDVAGDTVENYPVLVLRNEDSGWLKAEPMPSGYATALPSPDASQEAAASPGTTASSSNTK